MVQKSTEKQHSARHFVQLDEPGGAVNPGHARAGEDAGLMPATKSAKRGGRLDAVPLWQAAVSNVESLVSAECNL
jgi:hypothetical protein